ncbi:DUF2534 family protein [Salmonella enterica]|uniref:DUF2534 family protein n=2 Tax=Salmonella diarizonae TaxID=59204 RepID=A0A7U5YLA5_SALDZ|nr:hypothetical protein DOE59_22905 [Salmonella enterica subsp. diarizonae serovar 48:i:z]EAA2775551.1 hypothetical protein [Salmonella enterica subsp. diarizonae]EAM6407461.1 DUF2534 family protein [Salmonella enterica]EBQ4837960.1 DUF2534 family protein [Salmonella enterica subsp. arizonae]EDW6120331.1 DUF2534 family protein [Salmonella enterica subsp. salamae]EKN5804393.1 DUF2534 family protein [Salmonella enterica subsp. enterica]HCM1876069.1 DUF2534 family protein [Salmonella enterica su
MIFIYSIVFVVLFSIPFEVFFLSEDKN